MTRRIWLPEDERRIWTPGDGPAGSRRGQAPYGYGAIARAASIQFDAVSSSSANAADDLSFAHVCSTRGNRFLLVGIRITAAGFTSLAVTYNGVAMTQMVSGAGSSQVAIFGLAAPATGSNTIAITGVTTTPELIVAAAISLYNCKQSVMVGGDTGTTSGTTTAAPTMTTTIPGAWVIDAIGVTNDVAMTATGTGQVKRVEQQIDATASDSVIAMSTKPMPAVGLWTGGWSWTGSLNARWATCQVAPA